MSKAQNSFILPISVDAAHAACVMAAETDGWTIHDSDLEHFYLRQQISLIDRFYKYPSDCAIFLHRQEPDATLVELTGHIKGFGPLQRYRITKAVERLRAAIEASANTERQTDEAANP